MLEREARVTMAHVEVNHLSLGMEVQDSVPGFLETDPLVCLTIWVLQLRGNEQECLLQQVRIPHRYSQWTLQS